MKTPCPNDTNGDGDCGNPMCPDCGSYPRIHKDDLKELQKKAQRYDILKNTPRALLVAFFDRNLGRKQSFDDLVDSIGDRHKEVVPPVQKEPIMEVAPVNEAELFSHPYDQVICNSPSERDTVLEYAQILGKKVSGWMFHWSKFPINFFLEGPIVGWIDRQDAIGRKITFKEFCEWKKQQEEL